MSIPTVLENTIIEGGSSGFPYFILPEDILGYFSSIGNLYAFIVVGVALWEKVPVQPLKLSIYEGFAISIFVISTACNRFLKPVSSQLR